MRYKTTGGKWNETFYRKTIQSIAKGANYKGAIVLRQDDQWSPWEEVGVVYMGVYREGRDWVDAFKLAELERGPYGMVGRHREFSFQAILEAGEIKFPSKKCGLDNLLYVQRMTGSIERGPDNDMGFNGFYHYVVTDRGRHLGELMKIFLPEGN